ncbi:MAG TPA: hypothetical protein VFP43_25640 [Mesorhizobium sp.]|nr:hypothetical protein [Mesorhizobium sp.]
MKFDWKVAIPWFLSLVTVAVGIWQYADKQAQANREPFLRKQLDLIFEASDTVSLLANSTNPEAWEKARARFWVLYWGPLGIVEDNRIARCMIEASKLVPAPEVKTTPDLPVTALHTTSIRLCHVARDFILNNWDVELPSLQPAGSGQSASCD